MPDDRLFHKRLGHSQKVNMLTALEEIAWQTYVQTADDFGVMIFAAIELRRTHDRLRKRTEAVVQRMLERIRDVGLIATFEHQGRTYCYQHDWQDFQKVRYPLRTMHPRIPARLLTKLSPSTQWLHTAWPGSAGRENKLAAWLPPRDWTPPDWTHSEIPEEKPSIDPLGSRNVPGTFRERSRTRARARVARGSPPPPSSPTPPSKIKSTGAGRRSSRSAVENLPLPALMGVVHGASTMAADRVSSALRGDARRDRGEPDDRRRGMAGADQAPTGASGLRVAGAARDLVGDGRGGARAHAPVGPEARPAAGARESRNATEHAPAGKSAANAERHAPALAAGDPAAVSGPEQLRQTIERLRGAGGRKRSA